MILLCSTYSSDESYNGDCDYATVTLDKPDLELLLRYERLFIGTVQHLGEKSNLYQMDYWGADINFWSWGDWFDALSFRRRTMVESQEFVRMPKGWTPPDDNYQSSECRTCSVFGSRVQWQAYPKHTSITVYTRSLEWSEIKRYLTRA